MSKVTPIEWCDSTVNPTSGCDGCELYSSKAPEKAICYARAIHEQRFAFNGDFQRSGHYAKSFSEVRMIPGRCREAAYWTDLRGKDRIGKPWLTGRPRCIFVGDLSDVMSAAVTDQYIEDEILAPMEMPAGRRHVWMILTKRPKRLADLSERRPGGLPRNCIAMTSVTNQATAEARIPQLLRVRARWHGISAEPLLDCVSLLPWLSQSKSASPAFSPAPDWVVIGGASGSNAGPTPIDWVRALATECVEARVPTFVKQLGSQAVQYVAASDVRIGAQRDEPIAFLHLHHKKGGDMAEWPASLAIREMPRFEIEDVGVDLANTACSQPGKPATE